MGVPGRKVDMRRQHTPGSHPRSMSSISSSDTSKMSSATKTTTKKTTKAVVEATVAAVPVAAAAAAPVAAAAPKATKATKAAAAAAAAVAAPVSAPVVPTASASVVPTATETVVVAEEDLSSSIAKTIASVFTELTAAKAANATAFATLKALEKQVARLSKRADRRRKRSPKLNADGTPAPVREVVFKKPVVVTDDLCSFLGKPKGTLISRSEVTKGVIAYAKTHSLMDKQAIKADAPLRKLLAIKETDSLTILNLQKYLNHHYIKTAPIAA